VLKNAFQNKETVTEMEDWSFVHFSVRWSWII